MKIKHPKLVYLRDKIEEFFYNLKGNDKWWGRYFIGVGIISVLYLICYIFFPYIKIPFVIVLVMLIWVGIPPAFAAIFMTIGLFVAISMVIFKTISECCFTKTIKIKCPHCNGTGCDACIGTGIQYIRIWKSDVDKILKK